MVPEPDLVEADIWLEPQQDFFAGFESSSITGFETNTGTSKINILICPLPLKFDKFLVQFITYNKINKFLFLINTFKFITK